MVLLVVLSGCLNGLAQGLPKDKLRLPNRLLAREIVESEMRRSPRAWALEGASSPKWTYTIGLELEAMMAVADSDPECRGKLMAYADSYLDVMIDSAGIIRGYKPADYKLDDLNSGKLLLRMIEWAEEDGWREGYVPRLRHAAALLYSQLDSQPRTQEGGFWHKRIYPDQMWLDGLYMSAPFRVQYAKKYVVNVTEREKVVDDVVRQFSLAYEHTYCPLCGLPHHAWDSAHRQSWADPQTGRSQHAWGRAVGWYMMALADVMELHRDDRLKDIFNKVSARLLELQDRHNGCWQQVLDCTGQEGNYFEMSASAMIAYSWLKGTRLGLLPKKYGKAAGRTLNGIKREFLNYNSETGAYTLTNICAVAGLSDDRDGTYEYYINEQRRDNDPKGMGPLIMALCF